MQYGPPHMVHKKTYVVNVISGFISGSTRVRTADPLLVRKEEILLVVFKNKGM